MTDSLNPVTCVTALYDIGREAIDGRSMSDYKEYLIKTLRCMAVPTVVFLDPTLGWKDELLALQTAPLEIIELPLDQTMMWSYKDQIEQILCSVKHKNPKDITNRIAGYCMIQYNKFDFLERVIGANPFGSQQFCWMDAGISRFIDTSKQFRARGVISDQFSLQTSYDVIPRLDADKYIGTNTCILKGGMWYMSPGAFHQVKAEVMRIWNNEMMAKGRIDNEQIALAMVYQTLPHLFRLCISGMPIGAIFDSMFEAITVGLKPTHSKRRFRH